MSSSVKHGNFLQGISIGTGPKGSSETEKSVVDFNAFVKRLGQMEVPIKMRVDLYSPMNKLCVIIKNRKCDCEELRKCIAEIKKRKLDLVYLYEESEFPANGEDIVVLSQEDIEWGYYLPIDNKE